MNNKLPWEAYFYGTIEKRTIRDAERHTVNVCDADNAEFIVTAVNAYEANQAEIKQLVTTTENLLSDNRDLCTKIQRLQEKLNDKCRLCNVSMLNEELELARESGEEEIAQLKAKLEDNITIVAISQISNGKERQKYCYKCGTNIKDQKYWFAKAKQDGRLVVLPCKFDDRLYDASGRELIIFNIEVGHQVLIRAIPLGGGVLNTYRPSDFGKTVFLSREAAEKAFAEVGE